MSIRIDRIAADLRAIAACTHTPGNGATRPTFSPEWGRARDYVIEEAAKVDCVARIDAAGNVFVKPRALPAGCPTWLCGSHLDTVPHGGDYDGVVGVVTALELLRSAHEDGVVLPVELVIFAEEEGPTFGLGMLGSRALVGELSAEQLGALKNKEGQTYLEAGAPYGVAPDQIAASRLRGKNHLALIELHIEQGPGMWRRDQRLAIVTAIAGRLQYRVEIRGEANHAGSTSMADRSDALAGAAELIHTLEQGVLKLVPTAVLTVGRLNVQPNAVNVIPDHVDFTIDFRDPDDGVLSRSEVWIEQLCDGLAEHRSLSVEFKRTESIPARPMATPLVEAFKRLAPDLPTVVSGALHDSAVIAPHLPTVMLFVPSRDGVSHNPAEFSRVEDIAAGAALIEKLVRRPTVAMLNGMGRDAFVGIVGRFYEHSPWIAERAWTKRPFTSREQLMQTMAGAVSDASREEQLGLIRAHPDLVGRLARENRLTSESTREQAAAGLMALSSDEASAFEQFNAAYRDKFGFPFVICARQNKKEAILAAFPTRLKNTIDQEIATALTEIHKIAMLRAADAVWETGAEAATNDTNHHE